MAMMVMAVVVQVVAVLVMAGVRITASVENSLHHGQVPLVLHCATALPLTAETPG